MLDRPSSIGNKLQIGEKMMAKNSINLATFFYASAVGTMFFAPQAISADKSTVQQHSGKSSACLDRDRLASDIARAMSFSVSGSDDWGGEA